MPKKSAGDENCIHCAIMTAIIEFYHGGPLPEDLGDVPDHSIGIDSQEVLTGLAKCVAQMVTHDKDHIGPAFMFFQRQMIESMSAATGGEVRGTINGQEVGDDEPDTEQAPAQRH